MTGLANPKPRVALFVTCLVDLLRPSVGFAAVKLLEAAGCDVDVPCAQTCCGQPAYNAGDMETAVAIARTTISALEGFDYVVAPSGSCAAMLKLHMPRLFPEGEADHRAAHALAGRVHELVSFLVDVRGLTRVAISYEGRVAYHDACSALRELSISGQPRRLLTSIAGLELVEIEGSETCCGFGGLFSVKYPEISDALAGKKTAAIAAAAPGLVVGPDLGCLMNIAGKLSREGAEVECRHIAELLAGDLANPPIGRPKGSRGAC